MIYVVTALHCEAMPFIREYELKRDDSARFFEVYRNANTMLIVSGIGKMKAAIATAHILSRVEPEEDSAVINIGTCGSILKELPVGTPILISKIRDEESGREYYPDMLLPDIAVAQGSLVTHNAVISRSDIEKYNKEVGYPEYIDMEASGFFQAAERFVGPHQIYVIKVISDYLEGIWLEKEYITDCMEKALPGIKNVLEHVSAFCHQAVIKDVFTSEEKTILERLECHLRLTNYQSNQLYNMARAYKIRTGLRVPEFKELMEIDFKTKEEGKSLFRQVCKILSTIKE